MSQPEGMSGPQFRSDRPAEQEAVRTTIVGGRPPGSGQKVGPIPRGIEVLLRKAAVDPAFKELLLRERGGAAATIGLKLEPSEALMLTAAPAAQLEAVITQTSVPQEHRRAFLGQAAAAMLAALGMMGTTCGCGEDPIRPGGSRPDREREEKKMTVKERVIATISGQTGVDVNQIKRGDPLAKYIAIGKDRQQNCPSLDGLREALEIRFDIKIPANEFEKIDSVGDLINHVETVLNKKTVPVPQPVTKGIRPDMPPAKA